MTNKITFNDKQATAVNFKDGAMGMIAGAGAGKTSILLGRVSNLIEKHKVMEGNILAISFTRATADELTSKLQDMGHHHVNVGTFHSICGGILRQEGINITGYNLIKEWQADNCFKNIDQTVDTNEVLSFISYQKSYMRKPSDEFMPKYSEYTASELREFYQAYESMKRQQNLYDFDDYLLLCLDVLKRNPGKYTYDYILVDEHQDSNKIQNKLLKEWSSTGNVFTASDFRQAIYSFRGGTTEYSMNFESHWDDATVHNVNINYRSPKNIVDRSNKFIKQYYGEYEHYIDAIAHKETDGGIVISSVSNREKEGQEVADKIESLIEQGADLNEIAVLYRVNAHADFVEAELKHRGIEYDIANDSSFFKRREIAGIISYLRLLFNTDDDGAFENVFRTRNAPLKYMSNKVLNDIQKHAQSEGISQYEASREIRLDQPWQTRNMRSFEDDIERLAHKAQSGISVVDLIDDIVRAFRIKSGIRERYVNQEELQERLGSIEVLKSFVKSNNLEQFITYVYSNTEKKKKKDNAVKLMSIHRSKGLEFDNVFVIGVEDGKFPHANSELNEEARLFYVACTRSKQNIWISEIGEGNKFIEEYGYDSTADPSINGVESVEVEDESIDDVVERIRRKMGKRG